MSVRGDTRPEGRTLALATPEGVELEFAIAPAGDRASAFLVDVVFIVGALAVLLAVALTTGAGGGWLEAAFTLVAFLLTNFYFVWFESRGRGTTPGKLRSGLRVMQADGSPLSMNAVFVRNVMRNIEILLPVAVLLDPDVFWPGAPGWITFLASAWLLVLLFMPLFNRRRLRVGDMVAGTVVVVQPRVVLSSDLGRSKPAVRRDAKAAFSFTEAQLEAYGEYELQVLEDVLRRKSRGVIGPVADRIARKIDWPDAVPAGRQRKFLLDFYTALRAHLERRMLFGRRKQDKHSSG